VRVRGGRRKRVHSVTPMKLLGSGQLAFGAGGKGGKGEPPLRKKRRGGPAGDMAHQKSFLGNGEKLAGRKGRPDSSSRGIFVRKMKETRKSSWSKNLTGWTPGRCKNHYPSISRGRELKKKLFQRILPGGGRGVFLMTNLGKDKRVKLGSTGGMWEGSGGVENI